MLPKLEFKRMLTPNRNSIPIQSNSPTSVLAPSQNRTCM